MAVQQLTQVIWQQNSFSKFNFDRDPLSAEALTVDTSIITSIANDYDFSKIFSRQTK